MRLSSRIPVLHARESEEELESVGREKEVDHLQRVGGL